MFYYLVVFEVAGLCPFFRENMAKGGGICVANHTSPIDAILLACDRNYALVKIKFIKNIFFQTKSNLVNVTLACRMDFKK